MFSHDFCLEELLKFSPTEAIFTRDNKGLTIFHCVAQSGSSDVLSLLLNQEDLFEEVSIEQRLAECDNKGRTPLQIAAAAGHEAIVRKESQYNFFKWFLILRLMLFICIGGKFLNLNSS